MVRHIREAEVSLLEGREKTTGSGERGNTSVAHLAGAPNTKKLTAVSPESRSFDPNSAVPWILWWLR